MPVLVTSNFDNDSKSMEKNWRSRTANSVVSGPILPRFYACSRYLKVLKRSDLKKPRKSGYIISSIMSQWSLSVAMDTVG